MYHFSTTLDGSFESAIDRVVAALQHHGMGVLTEIDVQAAFQKKLSKSFRRYTILGACHAEIAFDMLAEDDKAGTLYPCNIVVQEHESGRIEVSAIDPRMMFLMVPTPQAKAIAIRASEVIQAVMFEVASPQVAAALS